MELAEGALLLLPFLADLPERSERSSRSAIEERGEDTDRCG